MTLSPIDTSKWQGERGAFGISPGKPALFAWMMAVAAFADNPINASENAWLNWAGLRTPGAQTCRAAATGRAQGRASLVDFVTRGAPVDDDHADRARLIAEIPDQRHLWSSWLSPDQGFGPSRG